MPVNVYQGDSVLLTAAATGEAVSAAFSIFGVETPLAATKVDDYWEATWTVPGTSSGKVSVVVRETFGDSSVKSRGVALYEVKSATALDVPITRQLLEAVEAAILGTASSNQLSLTIAGRSISRIPIPDLIQLRTTLRAEISASNPSGAGDIRTRRIQL